MILIFFISFFIISLSIIGYGHLLLKLTNINTNKISIGYLGLSGIFLINIYSYFLSIFTNHTLLSNLLLILLGFVFFLGKNKKDFFQDNIIYILLIIIFFLGILIGKPHDDFEYYHFPYTHYLNQFDLIYGIGHLNHGFRTPSSIFYLNSVFNLPLIGNYSFSFGSAYYMIFANIILIDYLKIKNIQKNLFLIYFILFILLFINIFFYRIGEHGTDRSAQVLIFLLVLELLIFLNIKTNLKNQISILAILISLIISLKAFYIIYFVFTVLIIDYLVRNKKKKIKDLFNLIFNNFIIFFAIINITLIFFTYFKNTGCLIYPLSITCFENIEWAISKKEVQGMNFWYELWSKGGAAPNFRVDNPEIYVTNLNWLKNWIDIYFFNKVSDFILGLFVLSLIIFFSFKGSKKIKISTFKYRSLAIIIFLLLIEWFYNHPSLRYGGYCLVALVFAIFTSSYLSTFKQSFLNIQKKIFIFIIIALVVFVGRNISRLYKEYYIYSYNPVKDFRYNLSKSHFRISDEIIFLKNNLKNCNAKKVECKKDYRFVMRKYKDKYFIIKND